MVLQTLASVIYSAVSQSWTISTIAIKYLLIGYVVKLAYERDLSVESFEEALLENSRTVVGIIVTLGFLLSLVNAEIPVMFKAVGEVAALFYFGFLFWKY